MSSDELFRNAKSWPFEEAKKILKRAGKVSLQKGYILLETGYGPSGLPHIGTFGEVLRTTFVMNAFMKLSDIPCRLFAFSDDMDGLRKVPANIPNQEMMQNYIDFPLSSIPDPFEKYESFSHHNNAMLRRFLDSFGFTYEFKSSTEVYKSGAFNPALSKVLAHFEEIMDIMLPSLREERRKTYSPFLPICKRTGKVLQVKTESIDKDRNVISYMDPVTQKLIETSVLNGDCKLQWKADWGMRWAALGVDYEMSGKDLIDSVKLSSRICKVIDGIPPEGISYELFLDEEAKKISKSKGNGLSLEEWLAYAPQESLSYYMYQSPKKAKRLCFDVIPAAMDDYIDSIEKFSQLSETQKIDSAVFHVHDGPPPNYGHCLKFSLLLNLAHACSSGDDDLVFSFVKKYLNKLKATEKTELYMKSLVKYATNYYKDFIARTRVLLVPDSSQREALEFLLSSLAEVKDTETSEKDLQEIIFEVGKMFFVDDIKEWFKVLYRVLLGCDSGPKLGAFVVLYGIENTRKLIKTRLGQ
jgi:lysyl-tRNA synthetase class 1